MKKGFKMTSAAMMLLTGIAMMFYATSAWSHCQVPCGIYDDAMRVRAMLEDSDTVIKAAVMLKSLEGKTDPQSVNQQVRWVMNKESHAQKIIQTISDYFLTQRVKPSQTDYEERLKRHHAVIIAAMKSKQSASEQAANVLKKAIKALEGYYPHGH